MRTPRAYEIHAAPLDLEPTRQYASLEAAKRDAKKMALDYGNTLSSIDVSNRRTGTTVFSLRRCDELGWYKADVGGTR